MNKPFFLMMLSAVSPAAAIAQPAENFDLVCTEDTFLNGDLALQGQSRYSVDLRRGLACLQTSSGVSNNLCSKTNPVSRSGDLISFKAHGALVEVQLSSGALKGASSMTTRRGSCTRAAFTPFPNAE